MLARGSRYKACADVTCRIAQSMTNLIGDVSLWRQFEHNCLPVTHLCLVNMSSMAPVPVNRRHQREVIQLLVVAGREGKWQRWRGRTGPGSWEPARFLP